MKKSYKFGLATIVVSTLLIGCGGGSSSSTGNVINPPAAYMPYGDIYGLSVMIMYGYPAEYCAYNSESIIYTNSGSYHLKTTIWSESQSNNITCQDYGFGGSDIPSDNYMEYSSCLETDAGLGGDTACVTISKTESI